MGRHVLRPRIAISEAVHPTGAFAAERYKQHGDTLRAAASNG
jgi:hypothetical protein